MFVVKRALLPLLLLAVGALTSSNAASPTLAKDAACKRVAKTFVDCAVAKDYAAASGTWTDSCQAAFVSGSDGCLGAAAQYLNKSSDNVAQVEAGYVTKAGTIDAYIGVPGSKTAALNCKTCTTFWKKLFQSCVLPVTVEGGDAGTSLDEKAKSCIAKQSALDLAIASQCAAYNTRFDGTEKQVTSIRVIPAIYFATLTELCPNVVAYAKSNGAVTAKVLKSNAFY